MAGAQRVNGRVWREVLSGAGNANLQIGQSKCAPSAIRENGVPGKVGGTVRPR